MGQSAEAIGYQSSTIQATDSRERPENKQQKNQNNNNNIFNPKPIPKFDYPPYIY